MLWTATASVRAAHVAARSTFARVHATLVATAPPTAPPGTTPPGTPPATPSATPPSSPVQISSGWTLSDVFHAIWINLTRDGYQTGTALMVGTLAAILAGSRRFHGIMVFLVGIGGFWLGWLGWNTVYGQNNPLFPGNASATSIWDIAGQSERGFLVFAIVASATGYFVWQRMAGTTARRIFVMAAAVVGASLILNIFDAVSLA